MSRIIHKTGYVYMLICRLNGALKVGRTSNYHKRITYHNSASTGHFITVGVWKHNKYAALEKAIHEYLSKDKLFGREWFRLDHKKLLILILKLNEVCGPPVSGYAQMTPESMVSLAQEIMYSDFSIGFFNGDYEKIIYSYQLGVFEDEFNGYQKMKTTVNEIISILQKI